jgi:O-antigen/teichoic acid export membrane protein
MIFAAMIPVDIVLMQIFVRLFGIEGAAIATSCTFVTGMIFAGITIYNKYSVLISIRAVLNMVIASFVACLLFLFITPTGIFLLLCYILAVCIYAGVLWLLGELKKGDMDFLASAIAFGKSR